MRLSQVDLLLHPLKSELNWPLGEREPLDFSKSVVGSGLRWKLPAQLLDVIFIGSMLRYNSLTTAVKLHSYTLPVQELRGGGHNNVAPTTHVVSLDFDMGQLQEMDWRWVDESNLFEVLDPDGELDLPAQRAAVEE